MVYVLSFLFHSFSHWVVASVHFTAENFHMKFGILNWVWNTQHNRPLWWFAKQRSGDSPTLFSCYFCFQYQRQIHTLIRLLLLLWIQHCELNRFQTKIQCIRCILHLIFWTTSKLTNATNTLWRQKCAITFLKNTKNEHFMLALIAV